LTTGARSSHQDAVFGLIIAEGNMDTTTILIILLIILLVGGGGWYGRGRWY
jgi:hypothetical protein